MRFVVSNACNDRGRSILRSEDLDEGVFVSYSLFADFAVVKVLADYALVSDSDNGTHATTVAGNSGVLNQNAFRVGC